MGGRPVSALSIVVFPAKGDINDLEAILRGGADKIHEAGCVVLGGHSISDDQIKFGYAVTGLIDPARIWTYGGAKPGDVLLFSKRIGAGVIASALKQGIADQRHLDESIQQMLTLNRDMCAALQKRIVHACTDVTGFGLLGHAREMALASGVTLRIEANAIRLLPGGLEYSRAGAHSAGLKNNQAFAESCVSIEGELPNELEALLYDPQTSGGLLAALPRNEAEQVLAERPEAYLIGEVLNYRTKPIEVAA
jgi:selenide,water dikinase